MNEHHPPGQRRPRDPGADPLGPEKVHLFDRPANVRILMGTFYVLCAALLLAELFVDRHVEHSWERLWGFHALWGFVGVGLLVLVAKLLRKVVMRPEDYYDDA